MGTLAWSQGYRKEKRFLYEGLESTKFLQRIGSVRVFAFFF